MLGRVVVQPTLSVKTAPSVDPIAYVEAHFVDSEDAPILPGRVAIIRDGAFVGDGGAHRLGERADRGNRRHAERKKNPPPATGRIGRRRSGESNVCV